MSSLFERVVGILFGPATDKVDGADRQLVDDTIDVFVETIEPRVRLRSGYREKLADNVALTITHLRELGRAPLEPVVLARTGWSDDPCLRAVFAAADDVPALIGRSDVVRRFFDEHAACDEAVALLGMRRVERQVFAPRLEGEMLKNDVAQTTVCFSDHRLVAPAEDVPRARLEIGRLVLERLAQLVLERVVAIGEKTKALEEDKAMLAVKLRMLQRSRDGLHALVSDRADVERQIRDAELELKATSAGYTESKASLATLDGYIDQMNGVLAHPEEHVSLAPLRLRVTRMGVKVGPDEPRRDDDLDVDLSEVAIGDGLRAAIKLVRIPRAELPPREDLLVQAARLL
jgi:hypothetical protein